MSLKVVSISRHYMSGSYAYDLTCGTYTTPWDVPPYTKAFLSRDFHRGLLSSLLRTDSIRGKIPKHYLYLPVNFHVDLEGRARQCLQVRGPLC